MSDPHRDISAADASGAGNGVETTGNNAAQGRRGTRTFRILLASLALIVIIFALLYALNHKGLNTNQGAGGQAGTNNPAAASEFHASPPSPKQTTPGMPGTEPSGGAASRSANTAG